MYWHNGVPPLAVQLETRLLEVFPVADPEQRVVFAGTPVHIDPDWLFDESGPFSEGQLAPVTVCPFAVAVTEIEYEFAGLEEAKTPVVYVEVPVV